MVPQRIERSILIDAPVEVVWSVVTEPEHISGWFSDIADLDLRPGGGMVLRWNEHGTVHGQVERVEPPHFFSFRWVVEHDLELVDANATLVEFSVDAEGDATRLTVVETGFRNLAGTDDERRRHFDSHTRGWARELGQLEEYLGERSHR